MLPPEQLAALMTPALTWMWPYRTGRNMWSGYLAEEPPQE